MTQNQNSILITASVLGLTAIVLGAFAAHGLKELITLSSQQTFETGVRYQMYHALFLLFIGGASFINEKTKRTIFYLVLVGLFFFSGSIYALATNSLTSFNFKTIGFITPIGGLLLISAWVILVVNLARVKK